VTIGGGRGSMVQGGPDEDFDVNSLNDRERNLLEIYKLMRFCRSCSLINLTFCILGGLINWFQLIFIPFILCGYYGSKGYQPSLLYVYLVYCCLEIIFQIFMLFAFPSTVAIVIGCIYVSMQYSCLVIYVSCLQVHYCYFNIFCGIY